MKYKYLALIISVIFIFSCFGVAFAHPGHGTEYVEEVSSSSDSAPATTSAPQSSGSSGSSSYGGSGSLWFWKQFISVFKFWFWRKHGFKQFK